MDKGKLTINLGGPGSVVFLAFFCAKIFGFIDWSWFWVLSPLWIPFALIMGFIGFMFMIAVIAAILK